MVGLTLLKVLLVWILIVCFVTSVFLWLYLDSDICVYIIYMLWYTWLCWVWILTVRHEDQWHGAWWPRHLMAKYECRPLVFHLVLYLFIILCDPESSFTFQVKLFHGKNIVRKSNFVISRDEILRYRFLASLLIPSPCHSGDRILFW